MADLLAWIGASHERIMLALLTVYTLAQALLTWHLIRQNARRP